MGFLGVLFSTHYGSTCTLINKISYSILFADDTNILVSSSELNERNSKLNSVQCCISKWFKNKQLVLYLNMTHIIKFASSKLLPYPQNTVYNNRVLSLKI